MRSKWLEWPRVPEIIEKGAESVPTKPTKPSSVGFVGSCPLDSPVTRSPRSVVKLPVSDPYAYRMKAALLQINTPCYPAGMIVWLGTARPDLYIELTEHLPNEIQRLWSEREPLETFESVLARLVVLHRRCCQLYRGKFGH
jgi:hypothetical protein